MSLRKWRGRYTEARKTIHLVEWVRQAMRAVFIRARLYLLQIIMEGGVIMMAMFFAQRVVLGKTMFKDVPVVLKSAVAELLTDAGLGELAQE